MNTTTENLVLLILDHQKGRLSGKTLLQKRSYFVSEILGLQVGFRPHFYGPYSEEIESAVSQCKSLGFVEEQTQGFGIVNNGFEVRRYDYSLTDDGRQVVEFLKKQSPEESKRVSECLTSLAEAGDNSDYLTLSIAAKTFLILKQSNAPMKVEGIQKAAEKLKWELPPTAVQKAVDFLKNAHLVTEASP